MERIKSLLSHIKQLIPRGVQMFQDNNMSVYSAYATLFIVTAVFPCIILIISIVNLIPGYSAKDVADILFQILPDLGSIKDFVISLMLDIKDQSGGLLASAAAVTTLWAASKGVQAIQKGLDQLDSKDAAIETKSETEEDGKRGLLAKGIAIAKSILKRLVFTLTLIILIPALLLFEMLGDSIANAICSAVKKINPDVLNSTLDTIDSFFHISSLVVILLALLVILQIFAALPAKRRTLKSQLPGAILTGVCWFAFTELFSFFIPRFYHASNLYGSLASLFLVLLWLRFIVMILFAGGVLNRTLEEERQDSEDIQEGTDMDNQELVLRPADPAELEKVVDFYNYIIDAQEGQEYTPGWTKDVYPAKEDIESDIKAGEMHLGLLGDQLVCAEVITGNDDIYERVQWHCDAKDEEITVIHLLCVHPDYYGRSFARKMVQYAVDISRNMGRKVIHLDVIKGNERAKQLYLSEGFEYIGEYQVYYEDTGLADFWMLEKEL